MSLQLEIPPSSVCGCNSFKKFWQAFPPLFCEHQAIINIIVPNPQRRWGLVTTRPASWWQHVLHLGLAEVSKPCHFMCRVTNWRMNFMTSSLQGSLRNSLVSKPVQKRGRPGHTYKLSCMCWVRILCNSYVSYMSHGSQLLLTMALRSGWTDLAMEWLQTSLHGRQK